MKTLLPLALARLRAGETIALCTVLAREGSAPRGAGACLLLCADGAQAGTVGGGALEHAVLERAAQSLREGHSALLSYRLTQAEVMGLGMVCGGAVEAHCWALDARRLPVLEALEAGLAGEDDLWLARRIAADGAVTGAAAVRRGEAIGDIPLGTLLPLLGRRPALTDAGEGARLFVEPVRLAGHAYVFGGGHIAGELAPLLARLDFAPVVFDDRVDFANAERFPQAARVIVGDFCRIDRDVRVGPRDDLIIMTRGHSYDHQLLVQALRTPARYVGLIGSRSKLAHTKALLLQEGFTENDFARVHAPIGLAIHAQTPAEIAVSIAAELIACRYADENE